MREWLVAVTDKAGQTRTFLEAHDLAPTRRLGNLGPSELGFWLDLTDAKTAEVVPGSRLIRAYRDGVLRFHGPVWSVAQDTERERATVVAFDPSKILERRHLRAANDRDYANVDAGEIARTLVNDQPAVGGYRWYHHLEAPAGNVQASVQRNRTYDIGKQVLEALAELADVDGGFYYRIDPVAYDSAWAFQGSPTVLQVAAGELHVLYPDSGPDAEDVRFEYGDGTLANTKKVERTLLLPTNHALATGEQGSVSAREASALPSQDEFGVLMAAESFADVTRASTLTAHAIAMLKPTLRDAETVTFTPAPESPMLWDDFDVGVTGRLHSAHGALVNLSVRVLEAEVAVGDDGLETLTSLTVEAA